MSRSTESRSHLVLAFGFGILIVLIAVLGVGAIQRATSIYDEMQMAQDAYLRSEAFRRGIATDMYLADILVRDYLLDPSAANAPSHRAELLDIRNSLQQRLDVFSANFGESTTPDLKNLQDEVEGYWESMDPIFEWTPKEKAERTWAFLARKVLPRREAVVKLAREMSRLNNENLEKERARIANTQHVLHVFLIQMTISILGLGVVVALLTTRRVGVLERGHELQRREIEETQNNLRRLSNRLVEVQERERRNLSRELHDEVGQTMTALGIELGNLEDIRAEDHVGFRARLEDLKRLNAEAMRTLRDLAMGLRPSMLDDLGLQAALEWQGREFSRHTGVPAEVKVEGNLDGLSDKHSTCIYRVVQEALTNSAKHASARNVLVAVTTTENETVVMIQDDGIGFSTATILRRGLGLLGIRERVQVLEGNVDIISAPLKGTTIRVHLPLSATA